MQAGLERNAQSSPMQTAPGWGEARLMSPLRASYLGGHESQQVSQSTVVAVGHSVSSGPSAMSLPVCSELCSLERLARYRSACINGSPYAINKPIDIKGRRRW
ncbi:hypothetical protein AOLI_G00075020 [Acnodon oligacanthus]